MLRIAHRGASGHAPENSITSLKKAIDFGVDYVECDVQLTKDGVPLIRHDKLLDRTTNTTGYVSDYTLAEFENDIRLKNGEPVSTLESFCKIIAESDAKLYIDLKRYNAVEEVLNVALNFLPAEKLLLGCFNAEVIKVSKSISPEVKTSLILEGRPFDLKEIIEYAECDVVALGFDSVDQTSIDDAHAMNKLVFGWTINHPAEIERAKKMGLDGITSDYPDRI